MPVQLYFWPTPNGHKITIMLEETGIAYELKPVDIRKGEQFAPDFLRISPNNRIPAIVDSDGPGGRAISLFESGAILQYLGRRSGRLYPEDERLRAEVEQWLYWQVGNLGPACGQFNHFRHYAAVKVDYAIERFAAEVHRLYGVMEERLAGQPFLAADYSIADIAAWPWARGYERRGIDIGEFPHVQAWIERIARREAVQRALQIGEDLRPPDYDLSKDSEAHRHLFGQRARRRH